MYNIQCTVYNCQAQCVSIVYIVQYARVINSVVTGEGSRSVWKGVDYYPLVLFIFIPLANM